MKTAQFSLGHRRFKWCEVRKIRSIYNNGATQTELGKKYGISQNAIRNIVLFNTYKLSPKQVLELRRRNNEERLLRRRATEKGVNVEDIRKVAKRKRCALCGAKRTGRHGTLHIDHKDKKVRGLLCMKCNLGLGFFKDSVWLLQKAILYLKRSK